MDSTATAKGLTGISTTASMVRSTLRIAVTALIASISLHIIAATGKVSILAINSEK
jgi:hypothetical protein